jgi:hypothetical protein
MPLSVREAFQKSWGNVLKDFRDWLLPDTADLADWKTRPLKQAIAACPSRMVDDAEIMLAEWRKNQNANVTGLTSFLPVVLTAFDSIPSSPDVSSIRGIADWMPVILPQDPQKRMVRMRTIPIAVRAQIAIFTDNPHSALMFASQFLSYLTSETKRVMTLTVDVGDGITDDCELVILDNSLYPSKVSSEAKNLTIFTVDVTLNGVIPQIVGLGGTWDSTTDSNGRPSTEDMQKVVVEADITDSNFGVYVRWVADDETGETWLQTLSTDQVLLLENNGGELLLLNGKLLRLAGE